MEKKSWKRWKNLAWPPSITLDRSGRSSASSCWLADAEDADCIRPGSELQFFPWISENRNTNLVIKKM